MTKSPRKNVPDVGIELGAACMPSEHASDTAPGLITSGAASIFVRDIGRDICFNALLILQKTFSQNLDKAKNFSSLKFPICLIKREIIYLMAKQDIDFRACFKCK